MATPDVRIRLTAEGVAEVVAALRKVQGESEKSAKGSARGFLDFGRSLSGVQGLLLQLGAALSVASLVSFIKTAAIAAHDTAEMAQGIGTTVESMSALQMAARESNIPIEKLGMSLTQFAVRSQQFIKGTGPAVAAFRALGISADQFKGKDTADRLDLVARALSRLKDSPEKTALAFAAFGRNVRLILPVLNEIGEQGFDAVRKKAQALGLIFSQQVVANVKDLVGNFAILQAQAQALAIQFAAGLAPALVQEIKAFTGELGGTADAFRAAGEAAGVMFKLILAPILTLTSLLGAFALAATNLLTGIWEAATLASERHFIAASKRINEMWRQIAWVGAEEARTLRDTWSAPFIKPPQAAVRPTGEQPPEDDAARRQAALASAKALADAELKLKLAGIKAEQEALTRSLDDSLISLRQYYAERRRLLEQSNAAELAALEARRSAEAQGDDPEKARAAVAVIDAEIKVRRIESKAATETLAAEELTAIRKTEAERVEFERKITTLKGQEHQVVIAQIEEEVEKAAKVYDKLRVDRAATLVGPDMPRVPESAAFEDAAEKASAALGDLAAERQKITDRQAAGQITARKAESAIVELETARVPIIRQLADEAVRAARATGNLAAQDAADLLRTSAVLEQYRALRGAEEEAKATSKEARSDFAAFDSDRAVIEKRVQAGLTSQVEGQRQIIALEREQLPQLDRIAKAAMKAAQEANNPELMAQARDLLDALGETRLSLEATDLSFAKLGAAAEDAFVGSLAESLATAGDRAKTFGGIMNEVASSVIAALKRIAAQALALKIFEGIIGLIHPKGTGTVKSGTGDYVARGGQVTSTGIRRSGGGLVRGPGSGTSDSIPALSPLGRLWISNREFITRASAVGRPGVLGFLQKVNREDPDTLKLIERIQRSSQTFHLRDFRSEMRYAAGGLVGQAVPGIAGAAGAAGAGGRGGTSAAQLDATLTLLLDRGMIAEEVLSSMDSPEGHRVALKVLAKQPRAANQALRR